MDSPATGKIITLSVDPATAAALQRVAVPGFTIHVLRTAVDALQAARDADAASQPVVILAEHSEAVSVPDGSTPQGAAPSRPSEAATLVAAARMRCPHARRLMLVQAELMPWMIRLIHAGAVHALVALPLSEQELISAVASASWRGHAAASRETVSNVGPAHVAA